MIAIVFLLQGESQLFLLLDHNQPARVVGSSEKEFFGLSNQQERRVTWGGPGRCSEEVNLFTSKAEEDEVAVDFVVALSK